MTEENLKVFLCESGYNFPVDIDTHKNDKISETMKNYNLRGAPSLVLIDKNSCIRNIYFGSVDEIKLGYQIGLLLKE